MEVSLVSRHRFAYVIDDKNRAANIAKIRSHLTDQGILTCGRFAEFEYLNMDAVAEHAFALLKEHRTKLAEAGLGTRTETIW
jgi:UDP-galactopyranose mutase